MRSRTPLALMEQVVMALVFALTAALCVQAFVLAEQMSQRNDACTRALQIAQNAAEELKSVHGDYEQAAEQWGGVWNGLLWGWSLDEDWQMADGEKPLAYHVLITPLETAEPLLGAAEITVYQAEGTVLADLEAAWQLEETEALSDEFDG